MTKERARAKAHKRREWATLAEAKADAIDKGLNADPRYTDFAFWSEPIKIGHHSEGKHRRARAGFESKMQKSMELRNLAKSHREKADNLESFANRNAGDAEAKRQEKRAEADELFDVGSPVVDWCFGQGIIERVNKNTYSIRFASGYKCARDKSFIKTV